MLTHCVICALLWLKLASGLQPCVLQEGVASAFHLNTNLGLASCYSYSKETMDFPKAVEFCETHIGGHLAFIEDDLESILLRSTVSNVMWIGLGKVGNTWCWRHWGKSALRPATYMKWENPDSGFHHAIFKPLVSDIWKQVSPTGPFQALCEKEETPVPESAWIPLRSVAPDVNPRGHNIREANFVLYQPGPFECGGTGSEESAGLCARHCVSKGDCTAIAYSALSRTCCTIASPGVTADSVFSGEEFSCYTALG